VTKSLAALGHGVSLASFDPLLDPDMKDLLRLRSHAAVDVLHPITHENVKCSRSSGLLATGRSMDLLYPLAACHCMKKTYRLAHLLCWLAMPVSLCVTLVAVLISREWILSSAYVALWQMLSATLAAGFCMGMICPKNLFFNVDSSSTEESITKTDSESKPEKLKPIVGHTPRSKK
jgi:hypothetical protein